MVPCRRGEKPRVNAAVLSWDANELVELAASERIDIVLMADVVYPCKDATPLLDTLRRLLVTLPWLTIVCALTNRDACTHEGFEAALRQLPGDHAVLATERETDPVCGLTSVTLHEISPRKVQ